MSVLTQCHRATRPFRSLRTALLCSGLAAMAPAQQPAANPASAEPAARTADGVPTAAAREKPVLLAYWENDYFGGTDQHYTNGVKLAWLSPDLTEWGRAGWRQRFLEALPFVNREGAQKNLGISFGQKMFTPRDISRTDPDPLDRPYAGWSYFEFSFLAKTDRRADTIAVQLGMVGPHSYADDIQTWVHDLIDDDTPMGWKHQLHDEFGVNVAWERKWRLYARTVTAADRFGLSINPFTSKANQVRAHWGIDFVPHLGAVAGNVKTYANAGATVRFGYNLPSDFGVSLMRPAGLAAAPIDDLDPRVRGGCWSVFLFAGVDGRAVARDIFLDGNTFKDSRSVDKESLVADFTTGLGLVRGSFQFTFTQVLRTREFETQPSSHSEFGSVTLSWTF